MLALAALILVALLTACDSAEPTTAQQARPTDSARIATRLDPSVYLAGAGDPEDFLYRGVRQPDGTRAGDQDEIIDALARQGVNAIYFQMIRSHGGDGDDDHNPFLNNDPNSGLNPNVLDQWERWFLKLESSGINILLFFYDDSASVWRSGDELAEGEGEFIRAVVRRFGNLDNIIWVVAEEYSEALSAKKVSAIAKEISLADPIRRPVAVHKLSGTMFAEFASDPEIGVFAMQLPELSAAEINSAVSEAWSRSFGRYDLIMSEAPSWGTGLEAQRKAWASAFGGAHVLVYDLAFASPDAHELGYLRHLRDFAERFVLLDAVPNTRIVEQGSLFAMKSLDGKHFVYGRGTLGLSGIRPGDYDLLLFDPQTGGSVSTSVRIAGADWSYDVGDEFPSDVVAVLDPKQAKLARFPAARWNAPDPDGAGPGHQLLETSAEKIGGAGCVVNDGRMAFQWGDIGARREWASAAKPILAMLVGLAIQEGLIESIDQPVADFGLPLLGADRGITFRHLVNMTSGYARAEGPGEAWAYNDFNPVILGKTIESVFGATANDVLARWLEPLAFEDEPGLVSRRGFGLKASVRDVCRLGLMWLHEGQWDGVELLGRRIFHSLVAPAVPNDLPRSGNDSLNYLLLESFGGDSNMIEYGPGIYGSAFWYNASQPQSGGRPWPKLPGDAFQANGHFGAKHVTVIPSRDLVIVTHRDYDAAREAEGRGQFARINSEVSHLADAVGLVCLATAQASGRHCDSTGNSD